MATLACRVQFLDDTDPFNSTNFPEPSRPPLFTFREDLALGTQLAGVHRLLRAPHKVQPAGPPGCSPCRGAARVGAPQAGLAGRGSPGTSPQGQIPFPVKQRGTLGTRQLARDPLKREGGQPHAPAQSWGRVRPSRCRVCRRRDGGDSRSPRR
jgi:hypothetical protein